ncbi:MAG TPA: glycoside hydrolase family 5 protein [Nitrospira sp.]|nr:glycoside hydrolase family 5 protein [Nitrospira sp.]
MNSQLSYRLPPLITAGNRILRADQMRPVLLRGINRSGLEYSEPDDGGFLAAARITQDDIREMVKGWRANIIRLPFNQDWCLNGRGGFSAEAYLDSLDQVIAWAAEFGAYSILDLHWLDAETIYGTTENPIQGRTANHVPPAPNEETLTLWRKLAARYKDEPAIIFDILNEPHDVLSDDPHPLNLVGLDGEVTACDETRLMPQQWSRWAGLLTAAIREIKPDGLIMVSGVNWAFDLSRVQVNEPNIVYSSHIYSNRRKRDWKKALGRYRDIPIFVGEWGGTDEDLDFGTELASVMSERSLGWAAWSWSDFPRLVSDAGFTAPAFGSLVRSELSRAS